MSRHRRVLLVSESYDPIGGARIDKFAKYLPNYGWQVSRLCRRAKGIASSCDSSTEVMVPRALPSFEFLKRHFGWGRLAETLDRLVFIPDKAAAWAIVAAYFACRMVRRGQIDVVLTSSPRESVHLVGLAVQRFGIPWVADFRDLWTHRTAVYQPPTPFHDWVCRKLERSFYRGCDMLLANTPGNRELILADFHVDPHRVTVIPNGYDPDDFKPLVPRMPHPPMVFGYIGGLDKPAYPWREIIRVFEALNIAGMPVMLRVQGHPSAAVAQEVQQLRYKCVQLHPQVPHPQAIAELQKCDAAMVILADLGFTRNQVPRKLYQYLGAGLPILAVVPQDGCVVEIVRACGAGQVVAAGEWERAEVVIKQMYQEWQEGTLEGAQPQAADHFSYTRLVPQVAAILNQVCSTRPLSSPAANVDS